MNPIKMLPHNHKDKTNEDEEVEVLCKSFKSFMKNENRYQDLKSDLLSMNLLIETFTERYNDMAYNIEENKTNFLKQFETKFDTLLLSFETDELVSTLNLSESEIKHLDDLITSLNSKIETLNTISWNDSLMCQFCHQVIGSPISPCGHHICHSCYNIVPTKEVRGEHCQRSFYKLNYGKFCPVCYGASHLPSFLYVQNGQVTHQGVNMIPSINPYNLIHENENDEVNEYLDNSIHQ